MDDVIDITAPKLRVFLSYSRVDTGFVDELAAGLPLVGNFDVTLDRHSIETGVDWQERLEDLIEEADAVVFILSPDFARSDVCAWELESAERLGKRLVPVLYRPLGETPVPSQLGAINYVDAAASETLIGSLKTLGATLKTDLDWLKLSTRLLNLAQDWDEAGRPDSRLLVAGSIESATAWLESTPKGVSVTELQREFVTASSAAFALQQDAEQRRLAEVAAANARAAEAAQRGRTWALIGAAFSVVLAIAAGAATWIAWGSERRAELALLDAERAREQAVISAQLADQERETTAAAKADALRAARHAKFVMFTLITSKGLQNAGFNCENALDLKRPVEFLICAHPRLAEEDRTLSAQYFGLYGRLTGAARDKLKQDQRNWIRARYTDCSPDFRKDVSEGVVTASIDCAMNSVTMRNAQLAKQLELLGD